MCFHLTWNKYFFCQIIYNAFLRIKVILCFGIVSEILISRQHAYKNCLYIHLNLIMW